MEYNTVIVLIGVGLLGASAGLVGCFAVLRGRALLGDALAHAALPGLCLAFLLLGERNLSAMLAGALISGLLGVAVIASLRRHTRIKEDAAIGVVLSVFFGAGVVLSRLIQNRSTEGSKAGLDSYILGKTAGMIFADVVLIGGLALAMLVLVLVLFKEFQLVSFDASFGRVQGWPVLVLDLLLTGAVAIAVVIGLPAVGAVMMAALLILPSAAARFWADRLATVLLLSAGFGLATGAVGTLVSASASRMPAGPVIALVGTGFFLLSAFLAPRRGLLAQALARRRFRKECEYADFLNLLDLVGELGAPQPAPLDLTAIVRLKKWSPRQIRRRITWAMFEGDIVTGPGERVRLTPQGVARVTEAARRRRMWRLFLTEYPDLASLAQPLGQDAPESILPADIVEDLRIKLLDSEGGAG